MMKKKKKKQTGTMWVPLQPFDLHIGFVPDQASWNKVMKKYNVKGQGTQYPSQYGGCFSFFREEKGIGNFGLITLNEGVRAKSRRQVDALIVHEVSHAVDWIFECMHEHTPSTEVRAYLMQHIFQVISQAFEDRIGYKDEPGKRKAH